MQSKITSPLKYHGGKTYLASKIHEIANRWRGKEGWINRAIPFMGGGGEFWNWDYEGVSEAVNDIDERLFNFFRVLQAPDLFERFYRLAEVCPICERLWEEAREYYQKKPAKLNPRIDKAQAAYYFFVLVRQSMAGRGDCFTPLSKTRLRRGMNEQNSSWWNAVEGLKDVHTRLKRVAISSKDWYDFVKSQDGPRTLFYMDPPYPEETRTAKNVYRFEFSNESHRKLLSTLDELKGYIILSGYDCDLYASLNEKVDKGEWGKEVVKLANHAAKGDEKRKAQEILWFRENRR